jgi:hypothetical protein
MNKATSSCQRTRFTPVSDHQKDMFSGEVKKTEIQQSVFLLAKLYRLGHLFFKYNWPS